MAVINYSPEAIEKFLKEVNEANTQIQIAAERIEKALKEVEPKWQGDAQKAFMRFHSDWRKGIDLHVTAMKKSAAQLHRMSEEQQK